MKTIRIFISSPGDVAEERGKARRVVEALQKRYAGRLKLETVLWENLPLGAVDSFQGGIDAVLKGENAIDIAVFILWSRLGSPLGATIRKPDGSEYRSGTEREFDLMLAAREQSDDGRPEILVYVRQDDRRFKSALQERPTDEIEEMLRQHRLAERFIREKFHDAESGSNIRAYHTFPEPNSFAERLKVHLRSLLDTVALEDGLGVGTWEGSPYRGLEVFRSEHAPIFFGRDEEVCEALERLRAQAEAGCAFLLLVGASGSGKSSLARAGILSSLESDTPDESVAEWRTAALSPGECADGLCHHLARTLLDRIPELRGDDDSLDDLEQALRDGQGKALSLLLKRACAGGGRGPIRLVLLVDQLEELFTHPAITEAEAAAFLAALQALAVSGCVWVLATVRSDFYDRCQRFPVLMAMKGERGQIDLLPPEPSDIHRIITGPAVLAGLAFEKNAAGESLDQRILNDAVGHPEALPLIEFALAQLYAARTAEGLLTFVAYEKLGGVEGAIGRHAEAVFTAQHESVRAAFGPVFQTLVTLSESEDAHPVRRRVAMDTFATSPEQKPLVEALLSARLLSSDCGEIFVAHEALLRRWERVVQWIEANREFLRIRSRVAARMREGGCLLDGDPLLDAARHQLAALPDGFTLEQSAFIDAASAEVERRHRRVRLLRNIVMAGLSALTLLAFLAASVAAWQWKNARIQLHTASMADYNTAVQQIEKDNNWHEGVAYLVRALKLDPQNRLAAARLYSTLIFYGPSKMMLPCCPLAPVKVSESFIHESDDNSHRLTYDDEIKRFSKLAGPAIGPIINVDAKVVNASINSAENRILAITRQWRTGDGFTDHLRLWDAITGKSVQLSLKQDEDEVSARFSPDGTHILVMTHRGVRLLDALSGDILVEGLNNYCRSAKFSPDGMSFITAEYDRSFVTRQYSVPSGKCIGGLSRDDYGYANAVFSLAHESIVCLEKGECKSVYDLPRPSYAGEPFRDSWVVSAFSNSNTSRIVTMSDATIRIWDSKVGKLIGERLFHAPNSDIKIITPRAVSSPDGRYIVTAGYDGCARVWDANLVFPVGEPMCMEAGETGIQDICFSPDGVNILTVGGAKNQMQIWDFKTRRPLTGPFPPRGDIACASISPSGKSIASGSYDGTVAIWDIQTHECIGPAFVHDSTVNSVIFDRAGSRIATTSDDSAFVWDVKTGELLNGPFHHEMEVDLINTHAAFDSSGGYLLTTGFNETGRIWDLSNNAPIGEPLRHARFSSSGQFITGNRIQTSDGSTARIWDMNALIGGKSPVSDWMISFAHGVAGYDFNANGELQSITLSNRISLLRNIPSGDGEWTKLARWLVTSASMRTLTPESSLTFRQIAERERDTLLRDGLESALRYDPAVPLARLFLANLLEEENAKLESAQRDGSVLIRAAFLRRYDLDRLPDDATLWSRASRALIDAPAGAMVGIGPKAITVHAAAPPTAEKAVSLLKDNKPHPARLNLAHAYLFNGQFEQANAIYVKYMGSTFEDGRNWNDELRNDFKALREAGRDHPDMKKIEALLEP